MKTNNKHSAELISKTIKFLKEHKINQQEIESRINYTSLSKAKNFEKYPQVIIEKKTRSELLDELFNEFSLTYNEEYDTIENLDTSNSDKKILSDTQYYIMHYYAFARGVVDRALIKIINKRKVIMDYRINEHWEGTYSVIENYTFIEVNKMGYTTPVKKLLSLFSGTLKYGHSFLLGTYSTIKRDGYPAAGRVILEKADNAEIAEVKMHKESDFRIVSYLKDNVYITKLFTPTSLDEIVSTHHHQYLKLVGEYYYIMPAKNLTWQTYTLVIKKDFTAHLEINDVLYYGYVSFVNINVLNIRFIRKNQDKIFIHKQVLVIDINIRKSSSTGIFSAAGSSSIIHAVPSSFSCYLVFSENYDETHLDDLKMNLFLAETLV